MEARDFPQTFIPRASSLCTYRKDIGLLSRVLPTCIFDQGSFRSSLPVWKRSFSDNQGPAFKERPRDSGYQSYGFYSVLLYDYEIEKEIIVSFSRDTSCKKAQEFVK